MKNYGELEVTPLETNWMKSLLLKFTTIPLKWFRGTFHEWENIFSKDGEGYFKITCLWRGRGVCTWDKTFLFMLNVYLCISGTTPTFL